VLFPVLQLTEHAAHASHALTEQSTGQANEPQLVLSSVSGQGVPPPFDGCEMTRRREVLPPSQLRVHADQGAQAVTAQLVEGVGVVGESVGWRVGDWDGAAVGGS
jgi:hypothetical protein